MLDHTAYPYIFDTIIDCLDFETLHTMRRTCSAVNVKVSRILYRHVVFSVASSNKTQLRFVDPYHLKPLLLLDRGIPSSKRQRTAAGTPTGGVSVKEALERLTKHTRILDIDGDEFKASHFPQFRTILQPVITGAKITRGVSAGHPAGIERHCTLFVTIPIGPLMNFTTFATRSLTTSNIARSKDQLVVIITQTERENISTEWPSDVRGIDQLNDDICHRLAWSGPRSVSKLTIIKANNPSGATNTEWDTLIVQLAQRWTADPSHRPVTFSHKTAEEFQLASGMTDLELHLFTTPPGTAVPLPPTWEV